MKRVWCVALLVAGSAWAAKPIPGVAQHKISAVLSVQKGAEVSAETIEHLLGHREVKGSRPVFTETENGILRGLGASYLSRAWVLELRRTSSFDILEREIRRKGLPVHLDWNDLKAKAQGDSFESFQWAFKNRGEAQNLDLNPMTPLRVAARAGEDVRLPAPRSGRKVLVAVLDTGIDHSHPDLKAVIRRKPSECAALEKFKACIADKDRATCEKTWMDPKNPEVDRDGNGYPMDCHGWSLLGGVNAANIMGRPDFSDDQGHGTHVAGLIAAARNGGGVVGISPNVEILPVQVLGEQPSEPLKPLSVNISPSEEGRAALNRSLGDMVARGVIYAIHSGAQVINFSMGWPGSRDSEFMRSVIAEAQKRGIIVVAAAGNDSTRALLRPCAYPGVICVGASAPDGSVAHFSNHGSGVDLVAPGMNMLSTYPMSKRSVRFRQTLGYEFLSGTSQASPLVAGAIGEMLSRGIPAQDVYARLITSSRPVLSKLPLLKGLPHMDPTRLPADPEVYRKLSIGGNLDLSAALAVSPRPILVPMAKEKIEILWDRKARRLSFDFEMKNHWLAVDASTVSVTAAIARPDRDSVRPRVESVNALTSDRQWKSGETRLYRVSFVIDDAADASGSRIPSELDFVISVAVPGQPARETVLTAEIIVEVTPSLAGSDIEVLTVDGLPKGRFSYLPVDQAFDDSVSKRDYMAIEYGRGTWTVHLISQNGARGDYASRGSAKIKVSGDEDRLREQVVARMDVDGDGKSEHVLGLLEDKSDEAEPSPMSFFIFDSRFQLKESFTFDSTKAQIPYDVAWMRAGGVLRPAWVGQGKDPARKPSLRGRWENPTDREASELRFYYLDRAGRLQAKQEHSGYRIVDIIEARNEQKRAGRVPVLLAKNLGTEAKPSYLYDFAVAEMYEGRIENFRVMSFGADGAFYRNLLDTRVDKAQSLDLADEEFQGSFWFGQGADGRQRVSIFDSLKFKMKDADLSAIRTQYDAALWVRAAFLGRERAGAFVLTNSEIQFHDLRAGRSVSTSFERYTFYPDMLMTNLYFPLTVRDSMSSQKLPALFTTESSQLSRGVKMIVPVFARDGRVIELVSPARLRLKAGSGCKPMETPVFQSANGHAFDYACRDRIVRVHLKF